MDRPDKTSAETRRKISRGLAMLLLSGLLGVATATVAATGAGCNGRSKKSDRAQLNQSVVPNPLEHPAEFCFATCARRTYCRLGKPEGTEQIGLFKREKARCIQRCIQWMKNHPFDAQAYHECYDRKSCSHMTACLAETKRLLQAAADPDRRRQCLSLCVDFGQCDASERRCMERCKSPDLAIYRALEHCENRSCPAIRTCVVRHVPQLDPAGPARSRQGVPSAAHPSAAPAPEDPEKPLPRLPPVSEGNGKAR